MSQTKHFIIRDIVILVLSFNFMHITLAEVITPSNISGNEYGKLLTIQSPDNNWKIDIGGQLLLDAAKYFDDDPPSLESGFEVRRARLYVEGTVWNNWDFKAQYDFTTLDKSDTRDITGFNDLYIRYTGFDFGSITAGHFKEPFSLDQLTATKYLIFMERALPNALVPGRNIGISLNSYGENWTATAGLYGGSMEQPTHDGHGVTGRATFSPVHKKNDVMHFGLSGAWRSSNDGDDVRFRARPESHETDIRLVDTGTIDADDFYRLGFDVAFVKGPFAIQTEYVYNKVNRAIDTNSDVSFDGYYIEGGWFLTGESRNYNFKGGNFKGVKPDKPLGKGGLGALQLVVRYSTLNLTDEDILGGEEDNITIGLNWYPTKQTRIIAEYINVLDVDGGKNDSVEPDVFQMRAQIYW